VDLSTFVIGEVEVDDGHQVEGAGRGRVGGDVGDDGVDLDAAGRGELAGLAQRDVGESTAVAVQPCRASQVALRPSPAPRSSAEPGGSAATSAAKVRFGSAVQTRSAVA
jgi:hypothetical protein